MGKKIVIELEIEEGKAIKDLDAVKKGFEKVIDEQEKQTKVTKEAKEETQSLGNALDGVTGGAITKFKTLTGGVGKATKSFKALKIAIAATGIGLLVTAVATLATNLGNSEEGQNRVNKLLKQFGVIVGNVTDIFYQLGTAVFAFFTRDMDLMRESFAKATDQIKNFGDETRREIDLQGELADKQAELNKIERNLVVDRAKANRERADLLEKAANREKFTASERIEFLKEAGKIEEDITNAEIKAAELRLEIKEQENTLSESSQEDLEAEAQLRAEVINLETARLMKQKEVTSQIVGALNEEKAASKALQTERQNEIKSFIEQQDTITTALESGVTKRNSFELTATKVTGEAIQNVSKQTSDVKKKFSEEEVSAAIAQDRMLLSNIAAVAGEGSAIGKAAAVAQATISGIEGVQNAYTTAQASPITVLFPPYPIVQAGLAAAFSAKQIQSILSVQTPKGGGSTPSVSTPRGASVSASQAPAFNVVGASPENQLAQVIGEREQQPVKAFVVSNDVTNAQALDRNIVQSASLG
jgi:hypothetical protein